MKAVVHSFYKSVAATSSEVDTYTPANGKKFWFKLVGGNAARNSEVNVKISYGTQVIFATHGDSEVKGKDTVVGDGSTQIKISLLNDSTSTETIGGYYEGIEEI